MIGNIEQYDYHLCPCMEFGQIWCAGSFFIFIAVIKFMGKFMVILGNPVRVTLGVGTLAAITGSVVEGKIFIKVHDQPTTIVNYHCLYMLYFHLILSLLSILATVHKPLLRQINVLI